MRLTVASGFLLASLSLLPDEFLGQGFTNVTASAGIASGPAATFGFGRGSAWDDFDGDGDQDVFLAEGTGGDYVVYWNQGNGVFQRSVVLAGGSGAQRGHTCVSADFDRDGDQDVYVAVGNFLPNRLFVNQGNGTFQDQAALRGVAHTGDAYSASWGDFDRDGWVDLYVGNRLSSGAGFAQNVLYRNNGNGTFTDVTAFSGAASPGFALAGIFHDADGDGWPDIVVANDKGTSPSHPPVAILRNQGNGTFIDVAPAWNANAPIDGMGIGVGDIDGDGDFDLFMTNVPTSNLLMLWDEGLGSYHAQASWDACALTWGLGAAGYNWSGVFLDYDCDGLLDLHWNDGPFVKLGRNTGSAPLVDVTAAVGLTTAAPPALSSCVVDFDDDGDLDLWLPGGVVPAQLVRNDVDGGNWLMVDLEGTLSNRDGFGAVVLCKTSAGEQRRVKISGEGYLSDGEKRLHFGLGPVATVDELEIRWPSGTVSYLSQLAANQVVTAVEPKFQISGGLAPGSANPVTLALPEDAYLPYVCGLSSSVLVHWPLGDGRTILVDVNDPLLFFTTIPGNSDFVGSSGLLPATGTTTMTLNVPPIPGLSGFVCWMIGVTWHPSYVSNIKSIVGPQRIAIP